MCKRTFSQSHSGFKVLTPRVTLMANPQHATFLVVGESRSANARGLFDIVDRIRVAFPTADVCFAHDQQSAESTMMARKGAVFIAGFCSGEILQAISYKMRELGFHVTILLDAIHITGNSSLVLRLLENGAFQISRLEAAAALCKAEHPFLYAYPKAEVSASVVVVCGRTDRVLLVQRAEEPFKGTFAIPGGFLRPLLETLEECAVRELKEETSLDVRPEDLKQIVTKSTVNRDPRGHVIDHSYLAVVRRGVSEAKLLAGDDASQVRLLPFGEATKLHLAADHSDTLIAALEIYRRDRGVFARAWQDLKFALNAGHLSEQRL